MSETTSVLERKTCFLVSLYRASLRYQARAAVGDAELAERICDIAYARRRFSYRCVPQLLCWESSITNHQKIYRRYREVGLAVHKRPHRKGGMIERQLLLLRLKTTTSG